MNAENKSAVRNGVRWLRTGLITCTLISPVMRTVLERVRQNARTVREQGERLELAKKLQNTARSTQTTTLNRLEDLSAESRELVSKQVRQMQKQTRQLEDLTRQLRKTSRKQARQSRKYLAQVRKANSKLGKDLVARSTKLTTDLALRGSKVTQDLASRGGQATQGLTERSSKVAQDLLERGSKATQGLAEQGSKATKRLAKRGRQVTKDLAARNNKLLETVTRRQKKEKASRNFWTTFGFGIGVVGAAIVTFRFVRKRVAQQESEDQNQRIELPNSSNWNGGSETNRSRPTGEVRRIDDIGTAVATMPTIDVEKMQPPADAAFIGVASTRLYYPVETALEAKDLVYFNSEDEALSQGFTPAHEESK